MHKCMYVYTDMHIDEIFQSLYYMSYELHPIWQGSTDLPLITRIRRAKFKSWFYHFYFVILGKSFNLLFKMSLLLS